MPAEIRQLNYPPELTQIRKKYGLNPELADVCSFYDCVDKVATLRTLWDNALGHVETVLKNTSMPPLLSVRVCIVTWLPTRGSLGLFEVMAAVLRQCVDIS
jgi:hypothetical protein